MKQTWPITTSIIDSQSDVLRTFLHLARQVKRRCHDEIRVRMANIDLAIEPSYINLCRGKSLLSYRRTLA